VAGRKICQNIKNNENSLQKLEKPMNILQKPRGHENCSGLRNEPGQWYFHSQKEPVAMEMASKSAMFLASLFCAKPVHCAKHVSPVI
jgi:hypothetical protein